MPVKAHPNRHSCNSKRSVSVKSGMLLEEEILRVHGKLYAAALTILGLGVYCLRLLLYNFTTSTSCARGQKKRGEKDELIQGRF